MALDCLQRQNDSCADEEEEFAKNIPVVIMFSLFSTVGVVGNVFILYIYGLKFKESTTRVFILSLAVFDLISCVTLPYKITLLRYGSLFSNPNLARLEIVRIYFLQTSVSILPLMSFDRYRRICQPFKVQMKPKLAKVLVTSVIAIMAIFTIVRMIVTSYTNNQCYRAEAFISSEFVNRTVQVWLRELNFIFVILPFILPLPILTVVYILIGVKVRKLGKSTGRSMEDKQDRELNKSNSKCLAKPKSDKEIINVETDNLESAHDNSEASSLRHRTSSPKEELRTKGSAEVLSGDQHSTATSHCTNTSTGKDTIEPGTDSTGQTGTGCQRFDVQQKNSRLQHVHPKKIKLSRQRRPSTSHPNTFSRNVRSLSGNEERQASACINSDQPTVDYSLRQCSRAPRPTFRYSVKGGIVKSNSDHREDLHESRILPLETENQERAVNDLTLRKYKSSETRLPWKRMTLIFFLITVVYVLSCLPFFIIYIIFRVAPCYGYQLLSQGGYIVLYNFVYITTVSNCFLYGFFDPRFKRELRYVMSSVHDRLFKKCKLTGTSL